MEAAVTQPPPPSQWYSWGSGASGLLAHGLVDDTPVPTLITAPPFTPSASSAAVASLACSGVYSLLCTVDGRLWHCGDAQQSCTLPGATVNTPPLLMPAHIPLARRITSVACGWSHCGCISDEGELYMWGNNQQHQLAIPAASFCPTPTLVPLPSPALSVACGWRHTIALTRSHQLLGWGDNRAGQLSVAAASSLHVPTPLPIAALPPSSRITAVHCGWRFSLLVASCGRVYGCGDNKHGQCGVSGAVRRVDEWMEVAAVRAVRAAVGWTHCLLLDAQGRMWTFGRRSLGQAGAGRQAAMAGSSSAPALVTLPDDVRVTAVACGSESCLCIDSDGRLWSWGWNEHGNAGRAATAQTAGDDMERAVGDVEQIVWVPRRLQVGEAETCVVAVVAGGASVFAAVMNR